MLYADADADHLRRHARFGLLVRRHLPVRRGRGMTGERLGVAEVDDALDQCKRVVESCSRREAAVDAECHDRARTTTEVFLSQTEVRTVGVAGVVHPVDACIV